MYDGSHGIRDVDLDIKSGTCFGFLGQNGAGKTTTIKILIGLIRPQSGTAIVDGYDVLAEPDKVRKVIGYLPDTYGLYDYMTGYDIVDYTARLHGFERQERKEIVTDLLKKLDLYEARDKKAGQYSKGMRQKLALARALVNDPDVLFLDEPTSGLDPQAARNIEDLINELKKQGKTLFITSHILPEVEKVCDRLAIIKERYRPYPGQHGRDEAKTLHAVAAAPGDRPACGSHECTQAAWQGRGIGRLHPGLRRHRCHGAGRQQCPREGRHRHPGDGPSGTQP